MHPALTVLILAVWYAGVAFFAWTIRGNLRTGDAGASGIALRRHQNPIRFWIRIAWSCAMLLFMAALPVIVLIRNDGSLAAR